MTNVYAQPMEQPYVTRTRGIKISVVPAYNEAHSNPEAALYVYVYTITIANESNETVQLISRHWVIRDGFNHVEHVVGDGVIGQQPVLGPGESFTYSSFCPLQTPTGTMTGSFQMRPQGSPETFDAQIGEFKLAHKSLVN